MYIYIYIVIYLETTSHSGSSNSSGANRMSFIFVRRSGLWKGRRPERSR